MHIILGHGVTIMLDHNKGGRLLGGYQIKTKMDFTVKRKLSNGCFKPFESNVGGDANLIKDEIHRSSTTIVFCKEVAVFGVFVPVKSVYRT